MLGTPPPRLQHAADLKTSPVALLLLTAVVVVTLLLVPMGAFAALFQPADCQGTEVANLDKLRALSHHTPGDPDPSSVVASASSGHSNFGPALFQSKPDSRDFVAEVTDREMWSVGLTKFGDTPHHRVVAYVRYRVTVDYSKLAVGGLMNARPAPKPTHDNVMVDVWDAIGGTYRGTSLTCPEHPPWML